MLVEGLERRHDVIVAQALEELAVVFASEVLVLHPVWMRPTPLRGVAHARPSSRLQPGEELHIAMQKPARLQIGRGPVEERGAEGLDDRACARETNDAAVPLHAGHAPPIEADGRRAALVRVW